VTVSKLMLAVVTQAHQVGLVPSVFADLFATRKELPPQVYQSPGIRSDHGAEGARCKTPRPSPWPKSIGLQNLEPREAVAVSDEYPRAHTVDH
jgi:hypothetical protein